MSALVLFVKPEDNGMTVLGESKVLEAEAVIRTGRANPITICGGGFLQLRTGVVNPLPGEEFCSRALAIVKGG